MQTELPGKKWKSFLNKDLRNYILVVLGFFAFLLILAGLNKAFGQVVELSLPEGRATCDWLNPQQTQSERLGPFPSEAAALDPNDPNSCAAFLIANPTYRIWFSQIHYREIKIVNQTASLNWTAPTQNEDGTPIDGDLKGYKVYQGLDAVTLAEVSDIPDAGILTYLAEGLPLGFTYYFAVTAYDFADNESAKSNIVNKPIP